MSENKNKFEEEVVEFIGNSVATSEPSELTEEVNNKYKNITRELGLDDVKKAKDEKSDDEREN